MNIKRNKISKKPRLFSSKNRSSSFKIFPTSNRPKTGVTRKTNFLFKKKSPPKKLLNRQNSASNINIDFKEGLDFRSVGPKSRIQDKIFNSYWEIKLSSPKTIFTKNLFEEESNNNVFTKKLMQEKMQLYKFPQINWRNKNPNNFLSHIGGNEFNLSQTITKITTRPTSSITALNHQTGIFQKIKNRPVTALNRIKGNNFIKRPNTALHKRNIRPKTAFSPQNQKFLNRNNSPSLFLEDSKNDNIIPIKIKNKFEQRIENDYDYKDSFFNEFSNKDNIADKEKIQYLIKEKEIEINKYKMKKYPNYESLIREYNENRLKEKSIKIDQADTDLLDLFDRSQKTNAATKAKDVNFDYCSTNQRIAAFMDFSQHLKLEAILKISKDIYRNKRNLLEYQSKHNIQKPSYGELLINKCPHFRDSNSLFHGFMPFEEEGQNLICQYNNINNIYDPIDYMPKFGNYYLLNDIEKYNNFINAIIISIKTYKKYINSDKFRDNDVKKFNINAFKKTLFKKIEQNLIYHHNYIISETIPELEELYTSTIKEIIMNYILRSPFERQRLNIKYYPRKVLPSSYTIAQHGSFNRTKYTNWVENYNNSFNFLETNLSLCNISLSGLINWTNSFSHVNLIYLKNLHYLKNTINTIHLDEFWRIQESYLNKVFHFMRDIYYRGAILITKKNKALKRKDVISEGKWTFKGFIPNDEENNTEFKDENYGMFYEDQLQDFWTNINLENLIDIRLTPSNVGYVTYFLKKQIDLSESDYDYMTQDKKIKLNNCISTYCLLFFRKLTEKALIDYYKFFDKYKSNLKILEELKDKKSYTNDLIYDSEEDIRLPQLISFFISPYVEPLISLKTKMNDHGEIKIEYDLDQVNDKISKIIENICSIFSSLPTSHFLEFKKILPSQREQIVKEHSAKLNEFFNSDKNKNKSFLEDYYKTFCPNLILEEVDEIESTLNVISPTEPFVIDIKGKIYRKVKEQYSELEECIQIFEPIKNLKSGNLDMEIKSLNSNWNSGTPDYSQYMKILKKIRKFKNYLDIIPIKLNYSMFAIDNRKVIEELRNKLNQNLNNLFSSLENRILEMYDNNNDKFIQIIKKIDIKLNTPEEVVNMEKIKNQVQTDITSILNSYEDSYKIMIFLIKENDLFNENIINRICLGIKNFLKFKKDKQRIDKMHQENKETLENNFHKERKELEEKILEYVNEINKLDQQTHITEYDKVNAIILYLKEDLSVQVEKAIEQSIKDEELLMDYKNEGFENFTLAKNKLYKLSILWENIQAFYREKKLLIHNFNEDIDLDGQDGYINIFDDIKSKIEQNKKDLIRGEEIIINMSKTIEDEINHISYFLRVVKRVFEANPPISEELKTDVMMAFEDKKIEQSCRETLFSIFSKKS